MYKKSLYLQQINSYLSALVFSVKNDTSLSLTNSSFLSEDFFKDLFNIVYGYNFINLNKIKNNYPGIDLGDKKNQICVQVTSQNNKEKIQSTIDTFEKNMGYIEYDKLIIFVVGYKKKHNTPFKVNHIDFDKDNNVWDIRTIYKDIYSLDINKIAEISQFLEDNLQNVVTINPIDLSEEDIKLALDILTEFVMTNFDIEKASKKKYKLQKREDGFIEAKNKLNDCETLFNNEIQPNLKYATNIERFLGEPINVKYQNYYFEITESLQSYYSKNSDRFSNIGVLFGFVFDEVINYKNKDHIDDSKLLILLHNMYFNCDLGNNPR